MANIVRNNFEFAFILLVWYIAGSVSSILGIGMGLLLVVLLYRQERYLELLVGFLFTLILSDNLDDNTAFAKSFKNIYLVLLAGICFINNRIEGTNSVTHRFFLPFILVAAFCIIYSPVSSTAIQKTLSYFLLVYAVPNILLRVMRDNGADVFKTILYFMLVMVVFGFLLKYYSLDTAVSHGGRLRGVFGNPNGLGVFLILFFILFTIVDRLYPDLFTRREKIMFYGLILYFTLATGSRTSLLAIAFFMLFSKTYKYSPLLGFLTFVFALVVSELITTNYELILNSLGLGTVFRVDTIGEGSGRLIAWEFAWNTIKESLIFGRGFGFDEHLMRSNFEYLSKLGHEGGVHNTYLIVWLNTGIFGLFLYLRAYFLLFLKAAKKCTLAMPAFLAILFSVNFEPWLASSLNPFTILVLVILTVMLNYDFVEKEEQIEEIADATLVEKAHV